MPEAVRASWGMGSRALWRGRPSRANVCEQGTIVGAVIEIAQLAATAFDRPEEEVYYPEEGPFPPDGQHWHACIDVVSQLRGWLRRKPGGNRTWVGTAQQIHYNRRGSCRFVIPDVAVFFGVDAAELEQRDHHRDYYRVWETRVAPAWVLEVAQVHFDYYDQMRSNPESLDGDSDIGIYAALGVAEFWRTDPTGRGILTTPLQGYRLADGKWHPAHISADAGGALRGHSDVLGLDLCWRDGKLSLFDPATDTWLPTYDDLLNAHLDAGTRGD